MAGRFVSLDDPNVRLPPLLALDTNVVIQRFLATSPSSSPHQARAVQAFDLIRQHGAVAILVPRVVNELLHHVILAGYLRDLELMKRSAKKPKASPKTWSELYKREPFRVRWYVPAFRDLLQALEQGGVLVIEPGSLDPLHTQFSSELADYARRFHLDASDSEILMEAARAGTTDLMTLDGDLRRAAGDFTIYGWP